MFRSSELVLRASSSSAIAVSHRRPQYRFSPPLAPLCRRAVARIHLQAPIADPLGGLPTRDPSRVRIGASTPPSKWF